MKLTLLALTPKSLSPTRDDERMHTLLDSTFTSKSSTKGLPPLKNLAVAQHHGGYATRISLS